MKEVRRRRLKEEVDKFEKAADFARAYDLDPTYISQLLNGHRNIGERSARKLEAAIGLPPLSLDTEQPLSFAPKTSEQHRQYDNQNQTAPPHSGAASATTPLITGSMLTSPQGRRLQKLINDLTANGMTEDEVLDLFISVAQSLSKSLSAGKKKTTERPSQDALKEMIKRGGKTS